MSAAVIAARVRTLVAEHSLKVRDTVMVRTRVSIGVATFPDGAEDMDALIAAADAADRAFLNLVGPAPA